jgi:hypothetical protein
MFNYFSASLEHISRSGRAQRDAPLLLKALRPIESSLQTLSPPHTSRLESMFSNNQPFNPIFAGFSTPASCSSELSAQNLSGAVCSWS